MTIERIYIGKTRCPDCGEAVLVKKSAATPPRAHFTCNGAIEGNGCGYRGTYGGASSRRMIAAHDEREAAALSTAPEISPEPETAPQEDKSDARDEPEARDEPQGLFARRRARRAAGDG